MHDFRRGPVIVAVITLRHQVLVLYRITQTATLTCIASIVAVMVVPRDFSLYALAIVAVSLLVVITTTALIFLGPKGFNK